MLSGKNLKDIIDVEVLQNIQDRLAEITGLAYNIVDFKGNPINNYSNFSEFCKKMRSTKEGMKTCCDTNAHAGLEAAIRQKPYIFKCPAGLVDVATPIIVNNNYLGAVFFGQVRTNNDKLVPIKESGYNSITCKKNAELEKDYQNTLYVDYYKIEAISSLVDIIVNQLIEKSVLDLLQEELNFNNIKFMKEREERVKFENQLKTYELKLLQSQLNSHFVFNILNTITSLALIEDAPKTQEVVYSLSEIFRYSLKNTECEVVLEEELKNVIRYLKIQSIRFGKRINYKIDIDEKIKKVKIPSMLLQCFVENSIIHGLCPKKEGGTINIKGYFSENNVVITIKDDGIGISEDELFSILNEKYKKKFKGIGIYNANEILASYYGEEYRAEIKSEVNVGTIVRVKIPLT
ncbi:PocR ligand-binding domain-containing protein [Clostridium sp. MB40-C1]|uniref:sensor histidine kinase n=1 Tax=Clostridium sp. MB40-C1 TaxID=3070996 RepID=UPI0027DF7439|nr:PocR ligand-binding domain-containing protein [Clostridium sp. MB40-C1]WMJ80544.1 PocR ligand-binding domain-containing protein [Clostridium sp. MB40-C1]